MAFGYSVNRSYLFYSFRSIFLSTIIFFTFLWMILGFDSTLSGLYNPDMQGIGIHWSSVQTFFITVYLITLNFSVNGVKSWPHLKQQIRYDLIGIVKVKKIRSMMGSWHYCVNPLNAVCYAFLIGVFCFAAFEIPYIFLLNYLHFDSLIFPTYMFNTNYLSFGFYRNFAFFVFPPILASILIRHKGYQLRKDFNFVILILITALFWYAWINIQSPLDIETPETLGLDQGNYTFPKQEYFPQTVYTYFSVPPNTYHNETDMGGWHQEDTQTHILNTATKYMMFFSITYIAMLVKRPCLKCSK